MKVHVIVYESAMEAYEKEVPFKDVLMQTPEVAAVFTGKEIDDMLGPRNYLGLAIKFTDRVLNKYGTN